MKKVGSGLEVECTKCGHKGTVFAELHQMEKLFRQGLINAGWTPPKTDEEKGDEHNEDTCLRAWTGDKEDPCNCNPAPISSTEEGK